MNERLKRIKKEMEEEELLDYLREKYGLSCYFQACREWRKDDKWYKRIFAFKKDKEWISNRTIEIFEERFGIKLGEEVLK